MNALDALKEIFHERKLDVPVILTTGRGHEDVALEALKLGASDYIVKSSGYLNHLAAAVEKRIPPPAGCTRACGAARKRSTLSVHSRTRVRRSTRIVDADGRITWANRSSSQPCACRRSR
jgi:DNA-binding NtrC family response regulator